MLVVCVCVCVFVNYTDINLELILELGAHN